MYIFICIYNCRLLSFTHTYIYLNLQRAIYIYITVQMSNASSGQWNLKSIQTLLYLGNPSPNHGTFPKVQSSCIFWPQGQKQNKCVYVYKYIFIHINIETSRYMIGFWIRDLWNTHIYVYTNVHVYIDTNAYTHV